MYIMMYRHMSLSNWLFINALLNVHMCMHAYAYAYASACHVHTLPSITNMPLTHMHTEPSATCHCYSQHLKRREALEHALRQRRDLIAAETPAQTHYTHTQTGESGDAAGCLMRARSASWRLVSNGMHARMVGASHLANNSVVYIWNTYTLCVHAYIYIYMYIYICILTYSWICMTYGYHLYVCNLYKHDTYRYSYNAVVYLTWICRHSCASLCMLSSVTCTYMMYVHCVPICSQSRHAYALVCIICMQMYTCIFIYQDKDNIFRIYMI
jgi:hypothetical protein